MRLSVRACVRLFLRLACWQISFDECIFLSLCLSRSLRVFLPVHIPFFQFTSAKSAMTQYVLYYST